MLAPPVIFAAIAGLFLAGMMRDDPDALPSVFIGRPAPSLEGAAPMRGQPGFDASVLRQPGVKLVNFWASWCPPCRQEHPELEALAAEGIPIYGVVYKDRPERAQAFLDELGNPFSGLVVDEKGRLGIEWGVTAPPETFVVDSEGKIVYRLIGPAVDVMLEKRLRPAIDGAE